MLFVKIVCDLRLSRCHCGVYHSFQRFCRGLRLVLLANPFDERFVAQRLAGFGGVADSADQGGVE
jgi:hypothetical protein